MAVERKDARDEQAVCKPSTGPNSALQYLQMQGKT